MHRMPTDHDSQQDLDRRRELQSRQGARGTETLLLPFVLIAALSYFLARQGLRLIRRFRQT